MKKKSETDLEAVDAMTDTGVDTTDILPLEEWLSLSHQQHPF